MRILRFRAPREASEPPVIPPRGSTKVQAKDHIDYGVRGALLFEERIKGADERYRKALQKINREPAAARFLYWLLSLVKE